MKHLIVKKIDLPSSQSPLNSLSEYLEQRVDPQWINVINWKVYPYRPKVRFRIAHNNRELFIQYEVKEKYIKAERTAINEMVCGDSCVEFFVSPRKDGIYYNFEFNPIGTCLVGRGHGRDDSQLLSPDLIRQIRTHGSRGDKPFTEQEGDHTWKLLVVIPTSIIGMGENDTLSGKTFRANFYKCGDELSRMHYLSWNPIDTPEPDFHRPEYFGHIDFE